jgi:hypothetical protein
MRILQMQQPETGNQNSEATATGNQNISQVQVQNHIVAAEEFKQSAPLR